MEGQGAGECWLVRVRPSGPGRHAVGEMLKLQGRSCKRKSAPKRGPVSVNARICLFHLLKIDFKKGRICILPLEESVSALLLDDL